ncbi:hypothetical protein GCM10025768_21990 [Microbacterium pseudoresistens]|uniref:Phospholipase n=1 Tax=Microbacterium pseudoresistens TaxID=640634 RepID=A0A7Y9EUV2_9MICO|nr:phospholipase [Microbacterium pseudoresistens]NYD53495.1 hypothetical protein [Microbacterium pseudoresistens]
MLDYPALSPADHQPATERISRATRDRSARHRRAHRRIAGATIAVGACLGLVLGLGISTAAPAVAATERVATAPSALTAPRDAHTAVEHARAVLEDATAIAVDVQSSGLDVGADAVIPDTAGLQRAIAAVEDVDVARAPDARLALPTLTAALTEQAELVSTQATALRGRLDTAVAAHQEQQAAAAALAAANTPEGAKATAREIAADQYGWGDEQFSCLESLWQKESGWNYRAYNSDGGATGIPQSLPGSKMASFGDDWETNATTQIRWGLDYISRAYGTPCSAWGHSQSVNWY